MENSHKENIACKDAIETAIREGFDGLRLSDDVEKEVLRQFGPKCVSAVLAYTVQQKPWEGRFSRSNREWAATVPLTDIGALCDCRVESHPGVLNVFISAVRRELARS